MIVSLLSALDIFFPQLTLKCQENFVHLTEDYRQYLNQLAYLCKDVPYEVALLVEVACRLGLMSLPVYESLALE